MTIFYANDLLHCCFCVFEPWNEPQITFALSCDIAHAQTLFSPVLWRFNKFQCLWGNRWLNYCLEKKTVYWRWRKIFAFNLIFFVWKVRALFALGPVHTYPDIFESATFSFRIRKYPCPHAMWSQRIHIEFARPHVFGFTPDSLRINKTVPPDTGSSRSNSESSRKTLLSYLFKLFLPAVLSVR